MNLDGIILSEISQTEKNKYCMISFYVESKNQKKKQKLTDTENRLVVTRVEEGWGWAKWVKGVNCMVTDGN